MFDNLRRNQSGAALMIVLILVVIVSIVGTSMLATTTYGLKNIVKTTKEQEEFYRAEGAIEIVLNEMANYQGKEGNGPLAYLQEKSNVANYSIGEKNVEVSLSTNIDPDNVKSGDTIELTLGAKYTNEQESQLSRVVKVDITVDNKMDSPFKQPYNFVDDDDLNYKYDKDSEHQIKIPMQETELKIYEDVLIDYGVVWPETDKKGNKTSYSIEEMKEIIEDQSDPSKTETLIFDTLDMSGNSDPTITIPENKRVFIKNVILRGSANKDQIVIKGALIVDILDFNGNSIINVHSGIVINEVAGQSKRFKVYSELDEATGISCELMKVTCERLILEEGGKSLASSMKKESISFSTIR
ncbi:hypothetical protein ACVBAX_07920 [Robertmurraya sp. GLU-23]